MPNRSPHEPDPELEEMDEVAELTKRAPMRRYVGGGLLALIAVVLLVLVIVAFVVGR